MSAALITILITSKIDWVSVGNTVATKLQNLNKMHKVLISTPEGLV